MTKHFRVFDWHGNAIFVPELNELNVNRKIREDHTIKRVEIYERDENETIWEERLTRIIYSKDAPR